MELNKNYDQIRSLGVEMLAIHVECSPAGTLAAVKRHNLTFPMANDERLQVVDNYSPTSAYVIDADGIIRARWLGSIHERVGPEAIIEALKKLATGAASVPERNRAGKP